MRRTLSTTRVFIVAAALASALALLAGGCSGSDDVEGANPETTQTVDEPAPTEPATPAPSDTGTEWPTSDHILLSQTATADEIIDYFLPLCADWRHEPAVHRDIREELGFKDNDLQLPQPVEQTKLNCPFDLGFLLEVDHSAGVQTAGDLLVQVEAVDPGYHWFVDLLLEQAASWSRCSPASSPEDANLARGPLWIATISAFVFPDVTFHPPFTDAFPPGVGLYYCADSDVD
jgi:hypothetical protein